MTETSAPAETGASQARRRPSRLVAAAGLLVALGVGGLAVFALTLWAWVLRPQDAPAVDAGEADAVVIFIGGRGERFDTAFDLIDAGVATTLVIPNGTNTTLRGANRLCRRGVPGVEVLCPPTERNDTGGEAAAIGALARERGWDRLVLVTTDYHVGRATLRLDRCFQGEVAAVAAPNRVSPPDRGFRIVREWLGHIEARTLERDC